MKALSDHLSVAEYLATSHADLVDDQWAAWESSELLRESAGRFAADVFEPAREAVGVPLALTSGFRCLELNRRVGGVSTSRHLLGLAADVRPVRLPLPVAMDRLHAALRAGGVRLLDKAIYERIGGKEWIHIQAAINPGFGRRRLLTTTDGKVFTDWRPHDPAQATPRNRKNAPRRRDRLGDSLRARRHDPPWDHHWRDRPRRLSTLV